MRPDPPPAGILLVLDLHKFNVVPEAFLAFEETLHYLSVMSSTPSNPAIASSHVLHVFVNLSK